MPEMRGKEEAEIKVNEKQMKTHIKGNLRTLIMSPYE